MAGFDRLVGQPPVLARSDSELDTACAVERRSASACASVHALAPVSQQAQPQLAHRYIQTLLPQQAST